MATFTRIKSRNKSSGALHGVLKYTLQEKKCLFYGAIVASGMNCCPQTAWQEMMTTKRGYRKTDGVAFYHFVQSFHRDEAITPWQVNQIGLELAEKLFPGYEVLVATHSDTDELHNHLIVNSVSCEHGKKLHLSPKSIEAQRQVNDQLCREHGLTVLEPYSGQKRKKGLRPGEYRAALRGESWKFTLIKAMEEALELSPDRATFIRNMEYEGYEVSWSASRKYITYTCPDGQKCRDRSLHDETYLKENLELLFEFRQAYGFYPGTPEPDRGWLADAGIYTGGGSVLSSALQLGKQLENMAGAPAPAKSHGHADSRQLRREALKKLAMGHKLPSDQQQTQDMEMTW